MIRLLKDQKGKNDVPNKALITLADNSLSPDAEAGDMVLVAQYMSPSDEDLVAYEHQDKYFVRWWRRAGSEVVLSDAEGNETTLPLSEVLVLGVVVEVRRPISHGRPA